MHHIMHLIMFMHLVVMQHRYMWHPALGESSRRKESRDMVDCTYVGGAETSTLGATSSSMDSATLITPPLPGWGAHERSTCRAGQPDNTPLPPTPLVPPPPPLAALAWHVGHIIFYGHIIFESTDG